MSSVDTGCLQTASGWFRGVERALIVTHLRPDGDAVGSLLGLHLLLGTAGISSVPYMHDAPGPKYARMLPVESVNTELAYGASFDLLCALDCANPERLDLPPGPFRPEHFSRVINIDHHPDNRHYGSENLVVPGLSSTAEVLLRVAEAGHWGITADAATALMTGLVTDCGTFRFTNTAAETFESAATLLRLGADYSCIIDALHFRESLGKLCLQQEILKRAGFAFDGRLVWSIMRPGDLERHGLHPQDTENIIDVLRCLETVEIACLIQPEDDHVRFSLRSRSAEYSAGRVARALGGGGHDAAAGARVRGISNERALDLLKSKVLAEFTGSSTGERASGP